MSQHGNPKIFYPATTTWLLVLSQNLAANGKDSSSHGKGCLSRNHDEESGRLAPKDFALDDVAGYQWGQDAMGG